MALKSSSKLDAAYIQALLRNEDAVFNTVLSIGGDGCNEIMTIEKILDTLDQNPGDICIASKDNDPLWCYFLGSETDVITMLENIN